MESKMNVYERLMEGSVEHRLVMEGILFHFFKKETSFDEKSFEIKPSPKYGTEDLMLKSLKFYSDELDISYADLKEAQATYRRLGPYGYGLDAENMVDIEKWKGNLIIKGAFSKSIFFGQLKDNEPNNFGIMVNDKGDIYEGFWKKGKVEGPGRLIEKTGGYFYGIFNNSGFVIEGTEFAKEGTPIHACKDGRWAFV